MGTEKKNWVETRWYFKVRPLAWAIGALLIFVVMPVSCNMLKRGQGTSLENSLVVSKEQAKNVHGTCFSNIKQQGLITEKQADVALKLMAASNEKYGPKGAQAAVLAIKEAMPNLPEATFLRLSQSVEACYNSFAAAQTDQLDKFRAYSNFLDAPLTFQGIIGLPRIKMEDYAVVVTSAQTKKDFSTGELSDPGIFGTKKENAQ